MIAQNLVALLMSSVLVLGSAAPVLACDQAAHAEQTVAKEKPGQAKPGKKHHKKHKKHHGKKKHHKHHGKKHHHHKGHNKGHGGHGNNAK